MFDAPDFISVPGLLKARAAEEGGERLLYFEASNEDLDAQGEVVLAKALGESSDYFLRYGNLDLDHYTLIGARNGIPDYNLYEIGHPVAVRIDGPQTFVKGLLFKGDSRAAENANLVWDSLTKLSPPAKWYPSVGGKVLSKSVERDPDTGNPKAIVSKVRWFNVGLSKTPVNLTVGSVRTVPFGVLAKSWTCNGLDLCKALESGYGTDSAALQGGSALRAQSLDKRLQTTLPVSYAVHRQRLLKAMGENPNATKVLSVARRGQTQALQELAKSVTGYACNKLRLPRAEAQAWGEQFVRDL